MMVSHRCLYIANTIRTVTERKDLCKVLFPVGVQALKINHLVLTELLMLENNKTVYKTHEVSDNIWRTDLRYILDCMNI
jgi:hypothetical protein